MIALVCHKRVNSTFSTVMPVNRLMTQPVYSAAINTLLRPYEGAIKTPFQAWACHEKSASFSHLRSLSLSPSLSPFQAWACQHWSTLDSSVHHWSRLDSSVYALSPFQAWACHHWSSLVCMPPQCLRINTNTHTHTHIQVCTYIHIYIYIHIY